MFSAEPNGGTAELESIVAEAIEKWIASLSGEVDQLIAAGEPSGEVWARLMTDDILPALGAEFIATGARSMPVSGIAAGDQLIAWPPGVDGPPTVQGLLSAYPATFAGISAGQVAFIVASPTWATRFGEYMEASRNLLTGVPDTVFAEMQAAMSKLGQGASVGDKRAVVQEFLAKDAEGSYVGWQRRAELIARTETAAARNAAAHAAASDVASAGVSMMKVWSAAMDERTRPDHVAADGQRRGIEEPFNVGGEPLDFPGDRIHGSAAQTINCRCVASYVEGEDAGDTLDWLEKFRGKSLSDLERNVTDSGKSLAAAGESTVALQWEGCLAPLGEETGDGRVFDPSGEFRFREFPLPLMWQEATGDGHAAARVVGAIDSGTITDSQVTAHGVIFEDEEKVIALLERGVIRPSVDLCDMVVEAYGDDEDELLRVTSATVMAATLVAKPAFENVGIQLTGTKGDSDAGGLVASATVLTLSQYSATAFEDPKLDGPTPVGVADDGRVWGHLALWDSCHIGMPGRCVQPPHSSTGYASFHQSTAHTDDGPIAVGRLTVGGGHANARDGVRAAAEHYDQTGATWAMVRAGEDEYGIWVAGQVHPDASEAQIRAGASAPLSGDWRRVGGNLELVAALSVSTPGFPVRREYTADDGLSMSLVASAEITPTTDTASRIDLDTLAVKVAAQINAQNKRAGRLSALDSEMSGTLSEARNSRLSAIDNVFGKAE